MIVSVLLDHFRTRFHLHGSFILTRGGSIADAAREHEVPVAKGACVIEANGSPRRPSLLVKPAPLALRPVEGARYGAASRQTPRRKEPYSTLSGIINSSELEGCGSSGAYRASGAREESPGHGLSRDLHGQRGLRSTRVEESCKR